MTAERLAEELQNHGLKWDRATVTKLETKRRQNITVTELFALALALDVPPLLLLLPDHGQMAVTPRLSMDPMRLALWANGLQPAEGLPKMGFTRSAAAIRLYFTAHEAIEAAKNADVAANQARGTDEEESTRARRDDALRRVADTIRPLLLDGLMPSGMPLGWITMMVDRGWLDSDMIPPAEVEGLKAFEEEAGDGEGS